MGEGWRLEGLGLVWMYIVIDGMYFGPDGPG